MKVAHPGVTNGLDLTYGTGGTYGGFGRFGRVVDQKWQDTQGTPVVKDRYVYGYDANSNRLYRQNTVAQGSADMDELYHANNATANEEYDGLNRLKEYIRGRLAVDTRSIADDTERRQLFTLDQVGNWTAFNDDAGDGTTWDLDQDRIHKDGNEIHHDTYGSAITEVQGDPAWIDPLHEKAGNMTLAPRPGDEATASEGVVCKYDAWNRLLAVYKDSDSDHDGVPDGGDTLIAEYRHDGLHRRIVKLIPGSDWDRTDYYYTTAWQVIEERFDDDIDAGDKDEVVTDVKYQYVWDIRYIDAPICRDEDKTSNGDCTEASTGVQGSNDGDEHLYYCNDANMNVTALVDDNDGAVVERYTYDAYGKVTVRHGARDSDGTDTSGDEWVERTADTFANEILFCGYRYDPETGLYHVRHRPYHPTMGRFLSRDPGAGGAMRIGAGGAAPVGGFMPMDQYADGMNLYQYMRSNPVIYVDPSGLGVETGEKGAKLISYMAAYDLATRYQSKGDELYSRVVTSWLGSRLISMYARRVNPEAVQGTEMAIRQFLRNGFRVGRMSYGFSPGGNVPEAKKNRYIYTCKKNWIDAGHYMISAGVAYVAGERNSLIAGYAMEVSQQVSLWLGIGMKGWAPSAFTAEDLMSNLLGARAGQAMRDATVALNPALQQRVQNLAGKGKGLWGKVRKVRAVLAFRPFDLALRFRNDLKAAGAVKPERQLAGGKDARYYLIKMGNWTKDHHAYWFYSRKPPGHDCVCDANNNPIGGSD